MIGILLQVDRAFPVWMDVRDALDLEGIFDGYEIDSAASASMFHAGSIDVDGATCGCDDGTTG